MWKTTLKQFEDQKQWDDAIEFMIPIVAQEQSLDAYLAMEYLLMNLLVEEDYDESKFNLYTQLAAQYFKESHEKFNDNAQYLFFSGWTASMSEWYFNIEPDDAVAMIKKAYILEPNNLLHQWYPYLFSDYNKNTTYNETEYAQTIVNNSSLHEELHTYGSLGDCIWELIQRWAIDTLKHRTQNIV